ncbi:MAG: DNA translocase FtsK 4TM domain-containing protein [Rickettsia endosymbiont of Pseudomimeciton antennatum]|nr:DNA translocase FtsK 4TM domain-containing protein [Rickettsia endosymbiont of Pseudomimeciton antennatum]
MLYYINRILTNNRVRSALLMLVGCFTILLLVTYNPDDPSFNSVTGKYPSNLLGYFGCYLADIFYQFFGIASFILPICCIFWSLSVWRLEKKSVTIRIMVLLLSIISLSIVCTKIKIDYLPAGAGGTVGTIIYPLIKQLDARADYALIIITFILLFLLAEIKFSSFWNSIIKLFQLIPYKKLIPLPTISTNINPTKAVLIKKAPFINQEEASHVDKINGYPGKNNDSQSHPLRKPSSLRKEDNQLPDLPPIELLKQADSQNIKVETSSELQNNAQILLTVLNDFGVKGQVINISQGPVVTLYEFEPAAGTKSSRIIGLSDDIARSLSAISTRIAVIPGRNVLGIELPNKQRAFFCLRELIETPEYQDSSIMLPLILGKDLAGKPFIADLAKMPHLLVAGTTGSGKSVAINAMIISLLYRYTPEECRLIMIDPKMLELSTYDGIPHLLTPVVTEPNKAVVALKWAVKEMENRYRAMSNIGVRNIAGYNAKILEAASSGKILERSIQTGFDSETGQPIYETIEMNMEKLPFIVVIVDEMADLMLVAGKDIELSIQRLAQMARAAGIHIIMATQRPSVDVITGVIKANFPSRISFKVTSKIDSRTILGEQGSEQLLGMGDMLYMGNSSKITRVHGPFVDDKEVEKVTQYLRSTGVPEYLSAVTQQLDDDEVNAESIGDDSTTDETLYKRAVQIVQLERKVSISYIQRCLRIGYNRAATLVEKMEQNGVISPANHTGKREILLPEN